MDNLLLLEYKEKKGQFHHNMVNDHHPQTEPDTYGWETIALTNEEKAILFCNIMNCKLHRREIAKQPPYTTDYIKKEWKFFSYVYNYMIAYAENVPEKKRFIQEHFDQTEALARLSNGHFSDIKEEKELPCAWEYDPFDFKDANF